MSFRLKSELIRVEREAWDEAVARGKEAHDAGINCAPVLDPQIYELIARHKVKSVSATIVLSGWHRGWAMARAAEPVYLDDGSVLELPK
jgi:hypothetical protein